MFDFEVTPEFLLVVLAGILAFVFDYFPWVAKWFDGLQESTKKLLNAGLLIVLGAIMFGATCAGWFHTNLVCSTQGIFDTLCVIFLALSVNYGVHKATKPSETLKARMFKRANPDLA